jgi:hypothetical protein
MSPLQRVQLALMCAVVLFANGFIATHLLVRALT